MKKLTITALFLAGMASSSVFAAETGQLNFSGTVQGGSCSIDGSADLSVSFPAVSAATISTSGSFDMVNGKPVSIKLKGCQEGAVTTLNVRGTLINGWGAVFASAPDSTVATKIFGEDGSFVFNNTNSRDYTMVAGANEIKLNAVLVAPNGTPAAQDFSIPLTYNLTYN